MARPLRLEFVDALYHVTSRGDAREDIYHGKENQRGQGQFNFKTIISTAVFSHFCSKRHAPIAHC
jgi:hypothetical protein